MIYPLITYPDGTEIVCTSLNNKGTTTVTIETTMYGGFKTAVLLLPEFVWVKKSGYTESEIFSFEVKLRQLSNEIIDIAKNGID